MESCDRSSFNVPLCVHDGHISELFSAEEIAPQHQSGAQPEALVPDYGLETNDQIVQHLLALYADRESAIKAKAAELL